MFFKRKREGDGAAAPELIVNKSDPVPERIEINTKVAKGAIRRETRNGREGFVVSSKTLPFGVVMKGGLYTREQIEANFEKLNGTVAPLGHPEVDGKPVSAFSVDGMAQSWAGAWNENARIEGNRVAVDKWVDIEVASRTEKGKLLVNRLEQLEKGEGAPIHTSVAVLCTRDPAPANAKGYTWVANIKDMDHDAILLDEPGAATPEQGVGLAVNYDPRQPRDKNGKWGSGGVGTPPVADGYTRLYHGSNAENGDGFDVKDSGTFDGVFMSQSKESAESHMSGSDATLYYADLKDGDILTQRDLEYEVSYDQQSGALRKAMPRLDDEDFDIAYEVVIEQKDVWGKDPETIERIFKSDDMGEASWEGQRIRGKVAKNLGYKAVEMDDEHGTSILVLPGAHLKKYEPIVANADTATSLEANAGVLLGLSFRERERMLEVEARRMFKGDDDGYVWIADFTDDQVVIVRNGGDGMIYAYTLENGKITIANDGKQVQRQESWVAVVANAAKRFFKQPVVNKEADMPLNAEDLAAIKAGISEAVAPLTQRMDTMEANAKQQFEALTANSRAEEAAMREAVRVKFGDIVANSLQGDALKNMHAQLGTAATIAPNSAGAGGQGAPSFKVDVA